MKVSVQYAQEHLADLATAASKGEEVEIDCPGEVSLRLTLVKPAVKTAPRRARKELWGAWEGLVPAPPRKNGMLFTGSFWTTSSGFLKLQASQLEVSAGFQCAALVVHRPQEADTARPSDH